MPNNIEWVAVHDRSGNKLIGAVAFVGNDVVATVAFFDNKDANKDGSVSWGEWFAGSILPMGGTGALEVVSRARDRAILDIANSGDPNRAMSLQRLQASQFQQVAVNMALDGIFKAYIAPGISLTGGAVAQHIGAGMVKSFAIKKGMEKAAKAAFDAAVK